MAVINIVGDGPGGLSAALFLAKDGHQVTVFGLGKTAMNFAYLYNYLGIPEIAGTEFQEIARRQVTGFGAVIRDEEVISVDDGPSVRTESETYPCDYLILTEGKNPTLALSLGLDTGEDGRILVDEAYRSSMGRVYVVGRSVRPTRSQAIISAGAGAVAALDILARECGEDFQDWDTPPKD